jgi:hypothetical protein
MTLADSIKRIGYALQRSVGCIPALYFPLYRLAGSKPRLAVSNSTELVIEGYPRCGNTFSVVAFEQAQARPVNIAHHLHVPAQVIAGVRRKLPVVVLIREPYAAISSLLVREPYLTPEIAIRDYLRFYTCIQAYQEHCLIVDFADLTADFGSVIARLNAKFGTDYHCFAHTRDEVQNVFRTLDTLETDTAGTNTDESKVARPSSAREQQSAAIRQALQDEPYRQAMHRAESIYRLMRTG